MQACKLPPPTAPVAYCLLATLWSSSLSLQGLFQAAAANRPEQGNAWLKGHLQSKLFQDAPATARVAAELYKSIDETGQQVNPYLGKPTCRRNSLKGCWQWDHCVPLLSLA